MSFTAAAPVRLTAATAAIPTRVHNRYGHSGWIQDKLKNEYALPNGGSAAVPGGWGYFWANTSDNSVAYTWPENYEDVYIHPDGYLYDSNGNRITDAHVGQEDA